MIGIVVTSKASSTLLFRYDFTPNVLGEFTAEVRAHLVEAVLDLIDSSFYTTYSSSIKVVNQGRYTVLVYNGEYITALLFVFNAGADKEAFLREFVVLFEEKFHDILEKEAKGEITITEELDFIQECHDQYYSMINVDVEKLSKIIQLIHSSNKFQFKDIVIFNRPAYNPIFKSFMRRKFLGKEDQIVAMTRSLLELDVRTRFPIETAWIKFRDDDLYSLLFNVDSYTVQVFVDQDQLKDATNEIRSIKASYMHFLRSK